MANEKVQIRERAGLEEARLNEELIDFLRSKTFTYICVLLAVGALGYSGYRRYEQIERQKVAAAFTEFNEATSVADPSPDSLERIAEAYDSVGTIGSRARLAAADAHLRVVRSGLKPGAGANQSGTVAKEDLLTDDERKQHLERAAALYEQVRASSAGSPGQILTTTEAIFGLAAVAECKRDMAGAKKYYEQIVQMTENGTFALQAGVARKRIAELDSLKDVAFDSIEQMPWLKPPAPPANPTVVTPNATPDQTTPAKPEASGPQAPADSKPADGAPAEKPADSKPADPKPADSGNPK